jgi:hypothetical protein
MYFVSFRSIGNVLKRTIDAYFYNISHRQIRADAKKYISSHDDFNMRRDKDFIPNRRKLLRMAVVVTDCTKILFCLL